MVLHCSVAKRCGLSCALLRARQRFSWRGSLRRLSCRNRFRSRSSGRAQPLCLCQVPESKMAKAKVEAVRRAKCSTLPPRHGPVGTRYYCAWATGQRNHIKNRGGSPPLRPTAAPRQRCPRTPHELPAEPYDHRNFPHALAGEAHLAAPHRRSARRRERARPAAQRNRRARVAAAPPAPPGARGTASAPEIAPPRRPPKTPSGEGP